MLLPLREPEGLPWMQLLPHGRIIREEWIKCGFQQMPEEAPPAADPDSAPLHGTLKTTPMVGF